MLTPEWFQAILGGMTLVMTFAVIPLWRLITRVRLNDLAHIQRSLDAIQKDVDELRSAYMRHLEQHAITR